MHARLTALPDRPDIAAMANPADGVTGPDPVVVDEDHAHHSAPEQPLLILGLNLLALSLITARHERFDIKHRVPTQRLVAQPFADRQIKLVLRLSMLFRCQPVPHALSVPPATRIAVTCARPPRLRSTDSSGESAVRAGPEPGPLGRRVRLGA